MNKKFTIIFIVLLISSCSTKVKCNGTNEKKLLIENLKKSLLTKSEDIKLLLNSKLGLNLITKEVDNLLVEFLEYLEYSNIRTLKVQKDINSCDCSTGLKLKNFDVFYNNLIEKGGFDLNSIENRDQIEKIRKLFEKEFNIDYKVQYTEDNKLFINFDNDSFLNNITVYDLFGMFFEMKQFNNKHSIDLDEDISNLKQEKKSEPFENIDYETIWKEENSKIDSDLPENFDLITNTFKEFIPNEFSVKSYSKGDANLDGLTDTMLILENNSNKDDYFTMILLLKQKNGSHKISFKDGDFLDGFNHSIKIQKGRIFILKYNNGGTEICFFKYDKINKKWILIESCSTGPEKFDGYVWKAENIVSFDEI